MKTMRNVWFNSFTAAALLVCNFVFAKAPTFHYALDKDSVLVGDRATLEMRLAVPELGEEDALPEVTDELFMHNEKLLVLQKDVHREENTVIWKYAVTSHTPQTVTLLPIQIRFGPNTFSTESTALTIHSGRKAEDQELREGFGKMALPIHWKRVFFLLCALGIFLSVLKPLVELFRRLKIYSHLRKRVTSTPKIKMDHLKWLREELSLLQQRIETEDAKETYVDELTFIVKSYFSRVHGKPIFTMTSSEFAYAFSADPNLRVIHGLFRKCDQFKFAPATIHDWKQLVLNGIQETEGALCHR